MNAFRNSATWLALFLWLVPGVSRAGAQTARLRGHVEDENGLPVEGAEIVFLSPDGIMQTAYSNGAGDFEIASLKPGPYRARLAKSGFFLLQDQPLQLKDGVNEVSFRLSHEYELHESVDVIASAQQIDPQQTDQQQTLEAHEIVNLPLPSSHELGSYLPSLPSVLRDHSGALHVSGGRSQETEFLLDGFEIGDPATGGLTTRLNVDTIRSVNVGIGSYGAQYSHGGAGVMALNTYLGDDTWRFGTTNFIPGISLQQGWQLGNWYPRFTLSGPLRKDRVWLSDALSLQHTLGIVSDLPRGSNTSTQWAGDNLLRLQANLAPGNILQGNFLVNRRSYSHLGLSLFSPLPTTRDLHSRRYFVSVKDQLAFPWGLVEFGAALDKANSRSLPRGSETYVIAPSEASGNYFETLHQRTHRWQTLGNLLLPSRRWHGPHNLRLGFSFDHSAFAQQAVRGSIRTEGSDGGLLLNTAFSGPARFRLANSQFGAYVQDSWQPHRLFLLQLGGRADWNEIIGRTLLSPRLAANFLPFADNRAKLTFAWGIYYQTPSLALLGLGSDQQRVDWLYNSSGATGPFTSRFVVPAGLEQPRLSTTSLAWEEKFGSDTFIGFRAMLRRERFGLAYEFTPLAEGYGGEFVLKNNRRDRYRSLEISMRRSFQDGEVFASYTRSRARSNKALDYTLENPLFAPQLAGALPWDTPNRLLSYGWAPTPLWHLLLSYHLEYRSGYPFGILSPYQQLIGPPDQLRFPAYLSLDVGVEKRLRFRGHEWAVRLSVINVTDHRNPDSVRNIEGAPVAFAGGQGRAFTARIRLVGQR